MLAHKENEVEFDGRTYHFDMFEKEDLDALRKTLNANTEKENLLTKRPDLGPHLKKRALHMEVRNTAIIVRKCVRSLDGKICTWCKENPHNLPKSVIKVYLLKTD